MGGGRRCYVDGIINPDDYRKITSVPSSCAAPPFPSEAIRPPG